MLSVLFLGFVLGVRHATDADHVVAVSAIVSRNKRFGSAWLLGAFWGLGHSLTIFATGGLIILLKAAIPPRVGLGLEFAVGVLLVMLGGLALAGRGPSEAGIKKHTHRHAHDDPAHGHGHGAGPAPAHEHAHVHFAQGKGWFENLKEAEPGQIARSLLAGLVHGLAGSAAVALLALSAIPDPRTAMFYLIVFAAGTLIGMLALSALMEASIAYAASRWAAVGWALPAAAGFLSVAFGLHIMYQTGFVDGLFLAAARWSPH